ncbi:MAG: tRNA pseudouridine(38-40) synthase TruA [Ruminococcaceae bacterium]|nr:tRNA pseudouridine(38-40) synthase TruA [Oscillospiraceae bacterium]
MTRFLLKISYDGTAYHGWQVQPNGITVQQIMCEKLSELTKERISVTGCSRTDAGVHANEFYCHFDTEHALPEIAYVKGLNAILPDDIAVIACRKVASDFHARYSAKSKEYIYKFYDGDVPNPFLKKYTLSVPVKLNIDLMAEFCEKMVGTYDFSVFSSSKRTVTDTVRTVQSCSVAREGDVVTLKIAADGFLYNMVRIVAGTALDVSNGKIKNADIIDIINSKQRERAGATLPPHALYLNKVIY